MMSLSAQSCESSFDESMSASYRLLGRLFGRPQVRSGSRAPKCGRYRRRATWSALIGQTVIGRRDAGCSPDSDRWQNAQEACGIRRSRPRLCENAAVKRTIRDRGGVFTQPRPQAVIQRRPSFFSTAAVDLPSNRISVCTMTTRKPPICERVMKRGLAGALLLGGLCLLRGAVAECTDAGESGQKYSRRHTVHNFSGEPPEEMTDTLVVWKTPNGQACFSLETWGPNGHQCQVEGALKSLSSNNFVFEAKKGCTLTVQRDGESYVLTASKGWERTGAGGVCPPDFCGMYGSIESGKFLPE